MLQYANNAGAVPYKAQEKDELREKCMMIKKVVSALPTVAMILFWISTYFPDKQLKYWIIVIGINMAWFIYAVYVVRTSEDSVVGWEMKMIIVDCTVCFFIAVYGIIRLYSLI